MIKQKTLICLFVCLCVFHIVDIKTYMKLRDMNENILYLVTSLEDLQADVAEQQSLVQEECDILYAEVQGLHTEIQKLDGQIATLSLNDVVTEEANSNRWNINLTDNEVELLARIVMLEAGGEPALGQEAVVEVIFNRIYREDFPDTLTEVLSSPKQFATWKNRNIEAATPTDEVYESINNVLSGKTHILPYETVYFGLSAENSKKQTKIGNHVFCNQY